MSKTVEIPIPRIRTGYYGNLKAYQAAGYTLISISRTTPNIQNANVKQLPVLAPSSELLDDFKNERITWMEYESKYREYIESLDSGTEGLIKTLACIVFVEGTKGVILLCYEKDYMKCHRSILADILNKSGILNEAVEEFNKYD